MTELQNWIVQTLSRDDSQYVSQLELTRMAAREPFLNGTSRPGREVDAALRILADKGIVDVAMSAEQNGNDPLYTLTDRSSTMTDNGPKMNNPFPLDIKPSFANPVPLTEELARTLPNGSYILQRYKNRPGYIDDQVLQVQYGSIPHHERGRRRRLVDLFAPWAVKTLDYFVVYIPTDAQWRPDAMTFEDLCEISRNEDGDNKLHGTTPFAVYHPEKNCFVWATGVEVSLVDGVEGVATLVMSDREVGK